MSNEQNPSAAEPAAYPPLPEMPEPDSEMVIIVAGCSATIDTYRASTMVDFAFACIDADRAARTVPNAAADALASMWSEYKAAHPSYRTSYEEGYLDALDSAEQRVRAIPAAPTTGGAA